MAPALKSCMQTTSNLFRWYSRPADRGMPCLSDAVATWELDNLTIEIHVVNKLALQ